MFANKWTDQQIKEDILNQDLKVYRYLDKSSDLKLKLTLKPTLAQ